MFSCCYQMAFSYQIIIIITILKYKPLISFVSNNYTPVSNLTTLSKILEKCILIQLSDHLQKNGLYAWYQSAYWHFNSFETALMKIYNDDLEDLTSESYVTMTFINFSTAFDTVNQWNVGFFSQQNVQPPNCGNWYK